MKKRKSQKLVLNKESVRVLSNESGKVVGGDWSRIDTCWCDPCAQTTLAESNCIPGPSFNYC